MRTTTEIAKLLTQLDSVRADDLEDQDPNFASLTSTHAEEVNYRNQFFVRKTNLTVQ